MLLFFLKKIKFPCSSLQTKGEIQLLACLVCNMENSNPLNEKILTSLKTCGVAPNSIKTGSRSLLNHHAHITEKQLHGFCRLLAC